MSTMNDTVPYTVPRERGGWRAIVLAVLMHLFLLLFLWVGVRWQNETPQTVEAEVWSPQAREAAPLPVPPPPAEPVKAPEPKPEPRPEPKPVVKEPPKPAVEEPPVVKPDIALEQEKKRKALEKKKAEEDLAKLKQKQKEEADKLAKARLEEDRLKKEKLDREKLEKEKLEKEKLAKDKAEKEKLEKDKAEKLAKAEKADKEKKDKAAAEEKRKQADEKRRQDEAADKMMADARKAEMARITGGAVGTGGTGDAARSQGPRGDPSYAARVGSKIKSNIVYIAPEELADNSAVEFVVDLLPDGSIAGMRKTRSSKAPGFDEAVRRAIEKSQPFPKDKTGSVPSSFIGVHRPKDQ
jgi:colicin import membrane protein